MNVNRTTLAVFCAINTISLSAFAADARSQAMGNTGVATSEYYLAAFHNPALGSHFRESDDFAILLPSVGMGLHDQDGLTQAIDNADYLFESLDKEVDENTPPEDLEQQVRRDAQLLSQYMDELDATAPLKVAAEQKAVVIIPTEVVSTSLFTHAYTEVFVATAFNKPDGYDDQDPQLVLDRFEGAQVGVAAFGISELGLSFSKDFMILGQDLSFGISPKYQQLIDYSAKISLMELDVPSFETKDVPVSMFNVDLGMAWRAGAWRAGLVAKNLIANEITTSLTETSAESYTYELKPEVALGLGYSSRFFTAALDVDLTKKTRFKELEDDTQFVRAGIEANAWGWAQLRAGYEVDLQETMKDSITAGIGLSPFDTINVDIAAFYADEDQLGASASCVFTF